MRVALVDDEVVFLEIMAEQCSTQALIPQVFNSGQDFIDSFAPDHYEIIFCDIQMPGLSGLEVFDRIMATGNKLPYWVFVSALVTNEIVKKAMQQHSVDLLVKPFSTDQFIAVVERAKRLKTDPFEAIYLSVEVITGVKFSTDYRTGISTRIQRRLRSLGFSSNQEYLDYFNKNRVAELETITSLLTTHTTSFFRESDHFDYLEKKVLPELFICKQTSENRLNFVNDEECVFWSAACSSGQEAYSIAMCCHAFLERERFKNSENVKQLKIVGTDVDSSSVKLAQEGIYTAEELLGLADQERDRYFQRGRQGLEALYKVKDVIWNLCSFNQFNLLSKNLPLDQVDVIFLRNVMIYFSADDIQQVIHKLTYVLRPGGYLFVGHTETGLVKHADLVSCVPGVFHKIRKSTERQVVKSGSLNQKIDLEKKIGKRLVAIGSSTGGTQALRKVLEHLRRSDFPPILIAQHFPEGYSQTFANMLATDLGVNVVIPKDREPIAENTVYLCPGNHHMVVDKMFRLRIEKAHPSDLVSPQIDRLMSSISENASKHDVLAMILTGMGKDGSAGLMSIFQKVKNAKTIAESPETAVVYGMPKHAFESGAAQHSLALPQIALYVKAWISGAT